MPKPLHRRRDHRRTRIGAALALAATAAISGVALAPHATAETGGHLAEYVCHPVNGAGELGDGWNLIPPDKADSHVDADLLALYEAGDTSIVYWKHMTSDGRHDIPALSDDPADADICPGHVDVEHLTVAQTITTSWDRSYTWSLSKSVDNPDIYLYANSADGPQSGTINWHLQASATAVDGNYAVHGMVAVTNDGDNDTDFTLTLSDPSITDVDCGGGSASAAIAKGAEVDCSYSASTQLAGPITATATTDVGVYTDTDSVDWSSTPTNTYGADTVLTDARLGLSVPLTAPAGYDQSFAESFTYAGSPCGDAVVTNNASLSTGQSASASTTVHRQCMVFQGDTAWAATAAKTGKYNNLTAGNWATYVKGPSGTWNLYAGQTKAAGTVSISAAGAVRITLANGFVFAPASAGANVHIQGYASPPSGNPSPGRFTFKKTCTASPCSPGTVTLASYYGIHLSVGKWVADPTFGP